MRVGIHRTGQPGRPIGATDRRGGFETTLWARRAASLEPYADTAAKTVGSPPNSPRQRPSSACASVGDDDVREVLYGESGVLAGLVSGGIVAIHSTVHPDTCRRSPIRLLHKGFRYRCPVRWRRTRRRGGQAAGHAGR